MNGMKRMSNAYVLTFITKLDSKAETRAMSRLNLKGSVWWLEGLEGS